MQWFCWGVVGADASSYSAITITSLSNNDLESFFFCGQSQINWKIVKETVQSDRLQPRLKGSRKGEFSPLDIPTVPKFLSTAS